MRILGALMLLLYGFVVFATDTSDDGKTITISLKNLGSTNSSFQVKVKPSDSISVLFSKIRTCARNGQDCIKLIYAGKILSENENEKATFTEKNIKDESSIFYVFTLVPSLPKIDKKTINECFFPDGQYKLNNKEKPEKSSATHVPNGHNEKNDTLSTRVSSNTFPNFCC